MKRPKPSLGELLNLYTTLGPDAQANQASNQRSQQLQQLLSAIAIGQGAQQLENNPADIAAKRAAEAAQLEAMTTQTNASKALLPGQLTAQGAQNEATLATTAGQNFQLEQGKINAPLATEGAKLGLEQQRFDAGNRADDRARKIKGEEANIAATVSGTKAQSDVAMSHLLPAVQAMLSGANVDDATKNEILARLSGHPELQAALKQKSDKLTADRAAQAAIGKGAPVGGSAGDGLGFGAAALGSAATASPIPMGLWLANKTGLFGPDAAAIRPGITMPDLSRFKR